MDIKGALGSSAPGMSWLLCKLSPSVPSAYSGWRWCLSSPVPTVEKAKQDWWLMPLIPTAGEASLSHIVRFCLKVKREGWHVVERQNTCEILRSSLSSAIKHSVHVLASQGFAEGILKPGAQV